MQSTTDTEVILHLVARSQRNRFIDRFIDALRQLEGAYSLVGADQQEADRRARPARHPPAGDRRARRPSDPRVGNLRARHHRRALRARRRERRGRRVRRNRRAFAQAVPADARRAPASSSTSISRGRIRSSAAAPVYDVRKTMGAELAREAPASRPTWSCRCRIPACRRRSAMRRKPASPTSSASSATTMSAAPSSSRRSRSAQLGVRLKHIGQPRRGQRQAHRAGRRFDRARHHLDQDRADDARCRRHGSAFPHRLAADHASGLLRHRHAGARQAARRDPYARGDAPRSSARIRSPSCRSTASTARWATSGAIRERPQFTDHCFTGDYPTPLTDQRPRASSRAAKQLSLLRAKRAEAVSMSGHA